MLKGSANFKFLIIQFSIWKFFCAVPLPTEHTKGIRICNTVCRTHTRSNSVVDTKLFFSDPDPTFQEISDPDPAPDPDPTQLLSKEVKAKF